MNDSTKQILSAIGNLPAGEKLFRTSKTTPRHTQIPLTTDDLISLRDYVERVEAALKRGIENCELAETFEIDLGRGWQLFLEEARAALKEQSDD